MPMPFRQFHARAPWFVLVAHVAGCAAGVAPHSSDHALRLLQSPNAAERQHGAEELAEGEGPSKAALPALYAAIRQEPNPRVYGALLVSLGSAGIAEARPLIDARINDPDSDTRSFAREALRRWLVRNMLLSEGEPLPAPPHRLYGPPGALPPGAPGAHATSELGGP